MINEKDIKNYKIKSLFLDIQAFFYNEISYDWSLTILYVKMFEYTRCFCKLKRDDLLLELSDYKIKYLFTFFGISNYYLREINKHVMVYLKMTNPEFNHEKFLSFSHDFKKWSKVLEKFEQTKIYRKIVASYKDDIIAMKNASNLKKLENSFYLNSFFNIGKKIYNIENAHQLMIKKKQNYKIPSIDKKIIINCESKIKAS